MIDEFLKKIGVKYEDLTQAEKETLLNWLKTLEVRKLTLEDFKDGIFNMLIGVAEELSSYDLKKSQDIYLKARLRNYLVLFSFLTSEERVKKMIEKYVKNVNVSD